MVMCKVCSRLLAASCTHQERFCCLTHGCRDLGGATPGVHDQHIILVWQRAQLALHLCVRLQVCGHGVQGSAWLVRCR